jgi:nucleotide-binding universal stress UspA family protein
MTALFQNILVAIDRSPTSEHVFVKALALAQAADAKLVILSVIGTDYASSYLNPSIYPGGESISISEAALKIYVEHQEQERLTGLAFLKVLVDRANAVNVATEISQQLGDAGRVICDVAKDRSVDLIVVGRRGHRGLNELFMGSVSNYVLHHAPCSVLTIQG